MFSGMDLTRSRHAPMDCQYIGSNCEGLSEQSRIFEIESPPRVRTLLNTRAYSIFGREHKAWARARWFPSKRESIWD